ncbi:MAG: hypothetical protein ABI780_01765 [Ardenticatenales bacterium]
MNPSRHLPPDRPMGNGQPFLTDADRALDAAVEAAQATHRETIRAVAEAEAARVLGADVMAHARWRGIPNEFFIGRRQFAVAIATGWGPDGKGGAVPFTHPVLYFRVAGADGPRGRMAQDWTPIRTLPELAEIEARAGR